MKGIKFKAQYFKDSMFGFTATLKLFMYDDGTAYGMRPFCLKVYRDGELYFMSYYRSAADAKNALENYVFTQFGDSFIFWHTVKGFVSDDDVRR